MDPRLMDPQGTLVDYQGMDQQELDQVVELLTSLRHWMSAEEEAHKENCDDMHLNRTDMQALRLIIAGHEQQQLLTPSQLAEHLGISSASTTKLLDRLERAGRISRVAHPKDRRAIQVEISPETREEVRRKIGHSHARRFTVAAQLRPEEREIVTKFMTNLANSQRSDSAPIG